MAASLASSASTNRVTRLDNVTCSYCGTHLNKVNKSLEHTVGRRFVPRGKLNANWNLLLYACQHCNNAKADLENDISAITLQPDFDRHHDEYDANVIKDAQRKGRNAVSRKTRKPVQESGERLRLSIPLENIGQLDFDLTAGPQIQEDRAFNLARLQLTAFFYFLTFQNTEKRGYPWKGEFMSVMMARRSDWGNAIMMDFMRAVRPWDYRLNCTTAEGFFRVCIRRHPTEELWSWVVEWNVSIRLIGFFGCSNTAQSVVDSFGPLKVQHYDLGGGDWAQYRTEVPLDPADDVAFDVD